MRHSVSIHPLSFVTWADLRDPSCRELCRGWSVYVMTFPTTILGTETPSISEREWERRLPLVARNTADVKVRNLPGWQTVNSWLDSRGAADTQEHYADAFVLFWTWALENPLKNHPTITNPDEWVQHRIAELRKENLEQYHCE